MAGYKTGPQLHGAQTTTVDEALRNRIRAFVAELGMTKARERLRAGESTLYEACERGRIKADTLSRLREALDREEPLLERKAS